jgi:hypothetical protein
VGDITFELWKNRTIVGVFPKEDNRAGKGRKNGKDCIPQAALVDTNAERRNCMTSSSNVEYCFLHYVPNIVGDKSVTLAAIFIDPTDLEKGLCTMSVVANWKTKVQHLDPDGDLAMLESLLSEIRDRLLSGSERSEMIRQLEDSFSNVVQISHRRKCPVAPCPEALDAFARELLERMSHRPRRAQQHVDRNLFPGDAPF